MSKLSQYKKDRISEYILLILFNKFPQTLFTSQIAEEVIRDEEFIKILLNELKQKQLIIPIYKNSKGLDYSKRIRWRLSNKIYKTYLEKQ